MRDPKNAQPCTDATRDVDNAARRSRANGPAGRSRRNTFSIPTFGGAIIPGRRNVFDTTLDLTGIAFLTDPRNLSPLISRLRFEAINNLRIEWDMDYDPQGGTPRRRQRLCRLQLGTHHHRARPFPSQCRR